jgi:hypothetical protein
MVDGKDEELFLEMLMFNYCTSKGAFTDEEEEYARASFRLQLAWYKKRKKIPKKVKDLL